jgi:hypothetical protein
MTMKATAVCVAVLACACAGQSPLPQVTAAIPRSPYAVFAGTVTLRGEIAVHGNFVDSLTGRHELCSQYVAGALPATTLWVVPTPGSLPVSGHMVMYTAGVASAPPSSGFHGPGTYTNASATVADLIIDNSSFTFATSTVIHVARDGSGTMSFTGMLDTSTNAAESGRVGWTCAD